jgi:hypothetical protein
MSSMIITLVAAATMITGFTAQNVNIVYWTEQPISNYGILLLANCAFPTFFGVLLLGQAALARDASVLAVADAPAQRSLWRAGSLAQNLCLIGLLNIANGFLIVYASAPDRTPPLIQAVLQNAGVLFSVPFSIWGLRDRKPYCSALPLTAALLIASSVAVSLLPMLLDGGDGGSGLGSGSSIAWTLVYLAGLAPGAAYNVAQQRYLLRSGALREDVKAAGVSRAIGRMLFWGNVWQTTWLLALWWVDLLPWFGTSTDVSAFDDNTRYSLACSVTGRADAFGDFGGGGGGNGTASTAQPCSSTTPGYAFGFIGGYIVSYCGASLLNRESSTFAMLTSVVTTMTTSAFFLSPGTNPNPSHTPLWSVLTSLALSLTGLAIWKVWESRIPAHLQFGITDDADADAAAVAARLRLVKGATGEYSLVSAHDAAATTSADTAGDSDAGGWDYGRGSGVEQLLLGTSGRAGVGRKGSGGGNIQQKTYV